jgi:ABC-type glycerol-3-phosphate transport system substrate-binding protein
VHVIDDGRWRSGPRGPRGPGAARTPRRRALQLAWLAATCAFACREPARPAAIRFLHTFGGQETELFNAVMVTRGIAIEPSLVPFARGRQMITEILGGGDRPRTEPCPDLVRIDATWLPGLVGGGLLVEPPAELVALDWSPEAAALAQLQGRWWGLPQSLDGLLVLRRTGTPAPASPSLADLIAAAEAARTPARPLPLSVRVDGYWFVPWLRGEGGELAAIHGLAGDSAVRAMTKLAALFGTLAPRPPPPGTESQEEMRRWRSDEIAYWITGPWQLAELGPTPREIDDIAVSALAGAPRGGQLLVVPRCTRQPGAGWRLARELTSVEVEARFAEQLAIVPTRRAALDHAPALARAAYDALRGATMLPRQPVTPLLFDDLNPALAAVVAGDATADEAIAGVRRGWRRLIPQAPP